MAQQAFFTVPLPASSADLYVKVGFIAGKIELTNLTRLQVGPVNGVGFKSYWQNGMAPATAITTAWDATPSDKTQYVATNGITLLGLPGAEFAQYGAAVSGFTNANPGVISVDSTFPQAITAGCIIRVANLADDQTGTRSLNGDYYVASVTSTSITLGTAPAGLWTQTPLASPNTSGYAVWVSGGSVTVLQNAIPTIPNPPYNIFSNVPTVFNSGIQGFILGTSVFPGAVYGTDVILVAAYDLMTP